MYFPEAKWFNKALVIVDGQRWFESHHQRYFAYISIFANYKETVVKTSSGTGRIICDYTNTKFPHVHGLKHCTLTYSEMFIPY